MKKREICISKITKKETRGYRIKIIHNRWYICECNENDMSSYYSFIEQDKVSGFWTWMFVLSKLPELGDTVFIVLRKKPLIFLHWYHHITVLLYTWYSFTEYTSSARWFVVMNYCVHRCVLYQLYF